MIHKNCDKIFAIIYFVWTFNKTNAETTLFEEVEFSKNFCGFWTFMKIFDRRLLPAIQKGQTMIGVIISHHNRSYFGSKTCVKMQFWRFTIEFRALKDFSWNHFV